MGRGGQAEKKTRGFTVERVSTPSDFYRLNKFVTIAADVMFVAGVPFFVTHSRKIDFTTVEYLPTRTARQLANALRKVMFIYARGGFLVRLVLMDMEFEKVKDLVPLVEINTTAAREHVGLIERKIRHVKEKTRATTSEFPFKLIPTLILIHTVYGVIFWLNAFAKHASNMGFSPREVVMGLSTDYARDCKVDVGSYVEASTDAVVTNDNKERTRSCVALGPVGNRQGSVKCFDIETGKLLHRRTVTQIPWPLNNDLIRKVESWGKRSVRAIKRNRIDFLNRKGEKFDWDNDDLSDLEVTDEQPKMIDPGVADVP